MNTDAAQENKNLKANSRKDELGIPTMVGSQPGLSEHIRRFANVGIRMGEGLHWRFDE